MEGNASRSALFSKASPYFTLQQTAISGYLTVIWQGPRFCPPVSPGYEQATATRDSKRISLCSSKALAICPATPMSFTQHTIGKHNAVK